jgi:atypical dual specificity phosphatase
VLLGLDRGAWIEEGLIGCGYPRAERDLERLSRSGVGVLVNLHERGHDPKRLRRHGLFEVHLPVRDFAAPSPGQLERGVAAIAAARDALAGVAVHCGGGLGRTGTLLACYLIHRNGSDAAEAIGQVRKVRPGSIETASQAEAVAAFARRSERTRSK